MTSLIRVTDVDTNQIKPFMPTDLFLGTILLYIVYLRLACAYIKLSGTPINTLLYLPQQTTYHRHLLAGSADRLLHWTLDSPPCLTTLGKLHTLPRQTPSIMMTSTDNDKHMSKLRLWRVCLNWICYHPKPNVLHHCEHKQLLTLYEAIDGPVHDRQLIARLSRNPADCKVYQGGLWYSTVSAYISLFPLFAPLLWWSNITTVDIATRWSLMKSPVTRL